MALGQEWASAELSGNSGFLERALTNDFIGVGPRGFLLTKAQWLDRYQSGDLRYESFTWDDVQVHGYEQAAVVTGRQTIKGSYKGHETGGQFRGTQVFVRQGDQWLLAALHLSPIVTGP